MSRTPSRGVTTQLSCPPDGDPDAAFRVQGQAVGHAADRHETPPAAQGAGLGIGGEHVHSPAGAVGEVERLAVIGPVQAVGQADVADDLAYRAVRTEPVQADRRPWAGPGAGAGAEGPPRVGLAVVEPDHGPVDRELAQGPEVLAIVIGQGEPVDEGEHQAAAAGQPDGADRFADLEPSVRTGSRVERVHMAREEIHPPQQFPVGIPDRSLGEFALGRHGQVSIECPGHGAIQSRCWLITVLITVLADHGADHGAG